MNGLEKGLQRPGMQNAGLRIEMKVCWLEWYVCITPPKILYFIF